MTALMLCGLHTSCSGLIYQDEGDCSSTYRVKFRYDHNMKFADAFASEVESVTLHAFDHDGVLRYTKTESGEELHQDGYCMTLDGLSAGTYSLVAWCGTHDNASYVVPELSVGQSVMTDATCRLAVKQDADGLNYIDADMRPELFHGISREPVTLPDRPGVHTVMLPLVKDINHVHVMLQHLSGEPVGKDHFRFTITDDNVSMLHDNSVQTGTAVTYKPWYVHDGMAGLEPAETGRAVTSVGVALADLTVGRLIKGHKPRLTVTTSEGDVVLSIPLIDYALLIKEHYREMSDQEYLDRQDSYALTFFLDERDKWMDSYIYINSWRVVLDDLDFE